MRKLFRNPIFWIIIAASTGVAAFTHEMLLNPMAQAEPRHAYKEVAPIKCSDTVIYRNDQYGFMLVLPEDWKGYTVIQDEWRGTEVQTGDVSETGPFISVRNPKWTEKEPYQDIPVYVFTPGQWKLVEDEQLSLGAAPIGPSELGKNEKYIFALPARYNYAFPKGWEEVDEILKNGGFKLIEEDNAAYSQ